MPVLSAYRSTGYGGFAKQSVQGTGVAPTRFAKMLKQAFMASQKVQDYRNGNTRDLAFSIKDSFNFAGAMEMLGFVDEAAFMLAMAMGHDVVTGSADPYDHTLTFQDPLPFFSFEASEYDGQILDRVIDSKIAKLTVSGQKADRVLFDVDMLGSSVYIPGSPTAVSFNDGVDQGPLSFYHGLFTLSGPSDASTNAGQIQKFSVEIDTGVKAIFGPGQLWPIGLFEEGRAVTVKLTVAFTGPAWHNLINYGASAGTAISETIGAGSAEWVLTKVAASPGPERSIDLTSAHVNWKTDKIMYDPKAVMATIDIEGVGVNINGSNPVFGAVIKNAVSAAYC